MDNREALTIGKAQLDSQTCQLHGPAGDIHLEPRVADVASYLARRVGEVVSRDALIESVWEGYPGADQALTGAVSKLRRALDECGGDPALVETVPKRGYRLRAVTKRKDKAEKSAGASLAVLPFRNLGSDPEDAYLCEGLAEELLNVLTRAPAVRVVGRTSSFAVAREQVGLKELGERLDVSHVLDGSVQRSKNRLRVRVSLVETATETQLWSREFEEQSEDLLAMQDAIARSVLLETLGRIGVESAPVIASPAQTLSPEAFNCFLKGRYFWHRDNTNPGKAFEYFHRAIELDPEFAAPYAGLVDCYCTYGVWQLVPQDDARERALDYAEQALALAPDSADVQFSHGYAQFYARWRWDAAERAMRRALEIVPDHVLAHGFMGLLSAARHRDKEAMDFVHRVVEIDPLSPWCWAIRGLMAYYLRDYQLAVDSAGEALDLEPKDLFALWVKSTALAHLGRFEDALPLTELLEARAGQVDLFVACAAANYAVCGEREKAERVAAELRARDKERGVSPLVFSFFCGALGFEDEAIRALRAAYDQHNMTMFYIAREPCLDPIRDRPEFRTILADLGLDALPST